MILTLDHADSRPIYLQIMDEIRRAMVLGTISGDEPLPSVRSLSAELKINPNTVVQAYRELEREGVVYVKRGLGTFVTPRESTDEERSKLARGVAGRALQEAYRHGLTAEQLIDAVREIEANEKEKQR